jgi:signal transduction histidine kinase
VKDPQYIHAKQRNLSHQGRSKETCVVDNHSSVERIIAAGLAHEIRNPLTTIKGLLQLLKPDFQSLGKEEYAELAIAELNRVNDLLSEFLTVAKRDSSQKKKISINHLVNSTVKLFSSEALLRHIKMTVKIPEQDLYIFANEKQIIQVIMNAVKNAFEAIEENGISQTGEVAIILNPLGEFAEVRICDNGIGTDHSSIHKLFTPFYTTKEKGTGLGLVISKQIVEDYGGSLRFEPSLGSGSVLAFTMPLA